MKLFKRLSVLFLMTCCLCMGGCSLFQTGDEVVDGSMYNYAGLSNITVETGNVNGARLFMDRFYGDSEYITAYYQHNNKLEQVDYITFKDGKVIRNAYSAIDTNSDNVNDDYELNQIEIGTYSGKKIELNDEDYVKAYIKDDVFYIKVETSSDAYGKLTGVISFNYVEIPSWPGFSN